MIGAKQLLNKYATLLPSVDPPSRFLHVGCDGLGFRATSASISTNDLPPPPGRVLLLLLLPYTSYSNC